MTMTLTEKWNKTVARQRSLVASATLVPQLRHSQLAISGTPARSTAVTVVANVLVRVSLHQLAHILNNNKAESPTILLPLWLA